MIDESHVSGRKFTATLGLDHSGLFQFQANLEFTALYGLNLQNYLTQHLLVVLCAEIEEHIRGFISERAEKANDPAIKVLVDSWAAERIRSVKYDQLIGIIKIFGEDYKQYFESLLGDDREQIISAYGIAVKGRINTAHYTGIQSQTTMMDFEKGLESAEKILRAFRKTLNSPISTSPPDPQPSDECISPTSEAFCGP